MPENAWSRVSAWQISSVRVAVVSDIHGNRIAFEAVLADLRQTSPDLILHGGDLAHGGANPAEIVDRIRDLGWQGVMGNTDEMLAKPVSLTEFAAQSPHLASLWTVIEEMAAATREALGEARIAWLAALPRVQMHGPMALVHASPETTWRAPADTALDAELEAVYSPLARPIAIYGHIHHPFVRSVSGMVVANTGSVSLSYDGDARAAYLLLDDGQPSIRRVEYDVASEVKALYACGLPHAAWIAKTLVSASPQMP
jgi:putative phosphoesterase